MAKLTDVQKSVKKGKNSNPLDIEQPIIDNKPEIDFRFLHKCNSCCFNGLAKYHNKHKEEKVFDQLQSFLFEISECKNIEQLIGNYTSKNGSKIKNNKFTKKIRTEFTKNYPNDIGLLKSEDMLHIHLKKNGNGKFVVFGVVKNNRFYVLAFDPNHDFNK